MSRDNMVNTKPVTILTGFLGAGKTTYLNHILQSNPNKRYAIIENEFGEEGIDSDLIIRAEEGIVELNNGCLCCSLNDNLYDILNTIYERRDDFDEVIIEATGIADPRGLAEPFIVHPAIKKQFPLQSIICLVDAELIFSQLESTEEAIHQVTYSDVLLINKTDLVSKSDLTQLKHHLQQLNPLAEIYVGNKGNLPNVNTTVRNNPLDDAHHHHSANDTFPVTKPHHHHHHDHTSVNSITLTFNVPFDLSLLQYTLTVFLSMQAKDLYRMKGLLWINGMPDQYLLQSVGKRYGLEIQRKWDSNEPKTSKLVLIGRNLQQASFEKLFSKCLAKSINVA